MFLTFRTLAKVTIVLSTLILAGNSLARAQGKVDLTDKEFVRSVQQRLKDLGFDSGAIDGSLGTNTTLAIKRFQTSKNLAATGQLDSATVQALGISPGVAGSRRAAGAGDSSREQGILRALKQDRVQEVVALVKAGLNLSDLTVSGRKSGLLHLAADSCALEIAKYVVKEGVDVNARADDATTALHRATRSGCSSIVQLLMERNASVSAAIEPRGSMLQVGADGQTVTYTASVRRARLGTPIHWAAYHNKPDVVNLLIRHGADVNANDGTGVRPIHYAALSGNLNIVQTLIQATKPADSSKKAAFPRPATPLHYAKTVEIAEFLVSNGNIINADSDEEGRPIHGAASRGHLQVMDYLLQHGAAVNDRARWDVGALNSVDAPPLWVAAWAGKLDSIQFLVAKGGNVGEITQEGGSLLHAAASNGNPDVIRYLVGQGLKVDHGAQFPMDVPMFRPWQGITPLGVAADRGHLGAVKALVQAGADVNAVFQKTWTPLLNAIVSRHQDIVVFMLQKGAKLLPGTEVQNLNTTSEIKAILTKQLKK